jgi:hypothetical protein
VQIKQQGHINISYAQRNNIKCIRFLKNNIKEYQLNRLEESHTLRKRRNIEHAQRAIKVEEKTFFST